MGNANTLGKNDVSLLWLLKNSKTVYRAVLAAAQGDKSGDGLTTAEQAMQDYAELTSLVIETAGTVTAAMEEYVAEIASHLVAESEFGDFSQDVYTQIAANALNITTNSALIETLQNTQTIYSRVMNGQIRRGFFEWPENSGQYVYGIAVSQSLSFDVDPITEEEITQELDGQTYYRLVSGQTFGLYTSTGWQYWINGDKIGWFDSTDGKLHTIQQEVEGDMQMGDWLITDSSGFGIKYIGG